MGEGQNDASRSLGGFDLAMHSWTAPVERTFVAAKKIGARVITPRLSWPTEPLLEKTEAWWTPGVPYRDAKQDPILANDANGRPARRD